MNSITQIALSPQRIEARLRAFLVENPNGCWDWTGSRSRKGEGCVTVKIGPARYRTVSAHRLAYMLWIGDIPADKPLVCHRCDRPACINPGHLFPGTQTDNMHDCSVKGRTARGEGHGLSRLTPAGVKEIRLLKQQGMKQVDIAARCGVCHQTVSDIVLRKRWAWLE